MNSPVPKNSNEITEYAVYSSSMQKSFQNQDSAECSKNDEIDTMHLHQENELHWGPESAKLILFLQKMLGCAKTIGRRLVL